MLCPICKKPIDKSERGQREKFNPFCSERCKLIDLGRWLGEKYQVPAGDPEQAPRPEHFRKD
jgi:hypothetical protein